MMKQFKEQMLRLQIQLKAQRRHRLPCTSIPSTQFGEGGAIVMAMSPNSEMCAAVGINGVLQIVDIKKGGQSVDSKSLREFMNIGNVRVSAVKWDPDAALLGVLLCDCSW